jgi:hypothetical protein
MVRSAFAIIGAATIVAGAQGSTRATEVIASSRARASGWAPAVRAVSDTNLCQGKGASKV